MSRITNIEIAGSTYPLNFSTKAAKQIAARYGAVENVGQAFAAGDLDAALGEVIWLLALLIEQGAAYIKITENKDLQVPTEDQLEILIGIADLGGLQTQLLGAMSAGMKTTVEVDSPNVEATRGA